MTGETLKKRLSANIKDLRKNRFTQETLSEAAGISWQMMNAIEGCRKWPSETTLTKIANALNVDIYEFFMPIETENKSVKKNYDAITKKVISKIRKVVDQTLNEMEGK